MKYFFILKTLYSMVLRDLVVKAIDDPDQEWDDLLLTILDRIFEYHKIDILN